MRRVEAVLKLKEAEKQMEASVRKKTAFIALYDADNERGCLGHLSAKEIRKGHGKIDGCRSKRPSVT